MEERGAKEEEEGEEQQAPHHLPHTATRKHPEEELVAEPPEVPPSLAPVQGDSTQQHLPPPPPHAGGAVAGIAPRKQAALTKFVLYETRQRYYLVGSDRGMTRFRVLKIDRTCPTELKLEEDPRHYSRQEIQDLLLMIEEGNKAAGGMKKTCSAYGVLGFIRFLQGYYLLLITQKSKIGAIGGHFIYSMDDTLYVYIPHPSLKTKLQQSEETRYKGLFFGMDTNKFYFSYSYDLTHTLQYNMAPARHCHASSMDGAPLQSNTHNEPLDWNKRFVWNQFLLKELKQNTTSSEWLLPVIHGYFYQSQFSVFGRTLALSLIARRSRYFAGTRFLKRGVTEEGKVANDVETEQILRGSIPLFWSQDNSVMVPKPPILVQRADPFYTASILHFQDLFARYGAPIFILNLVKSAEKKPRESILRQEFTLCVDFLNSSLPDDKKIEYIAWDFHKAAKGKKKKSTKAATLSPQRARLQGKEQASSSLDAISHLEQLAKRALKRVGFFYIGNRRRKPLNREEEQESCRLEQSGAVRTNCIDNLDRTNAVQFIVGKCALGHQLHALGMSSNPKIDFSNEICLQLMDMYQDMGNSIALQYGGSGLVNTMQTYSIHNAHNLTSQSRDLLTSFKRYYSNSFTDAEKQDSINLFLGNFIPWKHSPSFGHLWEMETDHQLHQRCWSSADLSTACANIIGGASSCGSVGGASNESLSRLLHSSEWWKVPLLEFTRNNTAEVLNHNAAATASETSPEKTTITSGRLHKDVADSINPFEEYHRSHTITLFDKELSFAYNEPTLSETTRLFLQKQKQAFVLPMEEDSNVALTIAKDGDDSTALLSEDVPQNPASGASYIHGIKRWLSWSLQRKKEGKKTPKPDSAYHQQDESRAAAHKRSQDELPNYLYGIHLQLSEQDSSLYTAYTKNNIVEEEYEQEEKKKERYESEDDQQRFYERYMSYEDGVGQGTSNKELDQLNYYRHYTDTHFDALVTPKSIEQDARATDMAKLWEPHLYLDSSSSVFSPAQWSASPQ
ncbi:phosphatidylinositol-3,5-bisphosphate 5-phosphatase [Balamuthia mandrillaris]